MSDFQFFVIESTTNVKFLGKEKNYSMANWKLFGKSLINPLNY